MTGGWRIPVQRDNLDVFPLVVNREEGNLLHCEDGVSELTLSGDALACYMSWPDSWRPELEALCASVPAHYASSKEPGGSKIKVKIATFEDLYVLTVYALRHQGR